MQVQFSNALMEPVQPLPLLPVGLLSEDVSWACPRRLLERNGFTNNQNEDENTAMTFIHIIVGQTKWWLFASADRSRSSSYPRPSNTLTLPFLFLSGICV